MLRTFILILLLFAGASSFAQTMFPVANLNPKLKTRANSVMRSMETTIDMRAPDQVIETVKKAITILNKNGDDHAALVLYYNKNIVIKSIKGAIYDELGNQTAKIMQSNFKDRSAISDFSLYEDDRVKVYEPNIISYPYTVVYEYEIRNRQNLIIPDWDANPYPDLAVEHNSYVFICKPEDQIRIKEYNFKGTRSQEKLKDQVIYKWSVDNLSALRREPYSPDPERYLTSVKIAPEKFVYYRTKGQYKDWTELGMWVYNDLVKPKQVLSPQIISEVKSLVADVEGDKNKAKKVYEYMQRKTRYISVQIGIGGYEPIAAMQVDKLGYGDCKALVNYTQSLLSAVNIPSYYCIVYAGSAKRGLDPEYASMNQANHIVLCLPFERDTTWLECTNPDAPFGFLGDFTDDRIVLACSATGGKLLKTPELTSEMNQTSRTAALNLDDKGSITGKMKTTFKGSQYDNYNYLITQSGDDRIRSLKKIYDIDNINFSGIKFEQNKGAEPSTTELLDLQIDRYASFTSNRIYLLPNAFNRVRTVPEYQNRSLPVYINRGYTDVDEYTYTLPDGYTIEYKPENQLIKSDFGSYSTNITIESNKILYKRKMIVNSGTWPFDKYAAFVVFMDAASSLDDKRIVLKPIAR